MIDERFFRSRVALSVHELAAIADAEIVRGDPSALFQKVAPLEEARVDDISFCHNKKYLKALSETQAGLVIVSSDLVSFCPPSVTILVSPKPLKAFSQILRVLYAEDKPEASVHPTAIVHETAVIGEGCVVGPGVVVEAGVVLGNNCVLEAHAVVHRHVQIGEASHIGSHVTISHAILGNGVVVKPGARIGQRGFGFFLEEGGDHFNQPQLGRVVIGRQVEIGSNATIDRGSLKDTVIGDGARVDNLVQIAHNVRIGKGCVIVAQVGVAGSSEVGDYSILAGQVGVSGHLTLGKNIKVAAKSGVSHNLPDNAIVGGIPAVPIENWRRQSVLLKRMAQKGIVERDKGD